MKPVFQTISGNGKNGSPSGNCFASCIASILELPLEEVPNFCEDHDKWCDHVNHWLRPRDLCYVDLMVPNSDHWIFNHVGYHILTGRSPRYDDDTRHCVVALGHDIVHDPAGPLNKEKPALLDDHSKWLVGLLTKRFVGLEEPRMHGAFYRDAMFGTRMK